MEGSVSLTLYFKEKVDLSALVSELAKRGLWVAKVLPTATGFEILSPEPNLIAMKVVDNDVIYKLYASPAADSITLFVDVKNLINSMAEVVSALASVGCNEACAIMADMNASFTTENLCPFGSLEVEGLGRLELRGIVATGEVVVSIAPLNDERSLMVISARGEWPEVKRKALSLRSLAQKIKEVLKQWSCQGLK